MSKLMHPLIKELKISNKTKTYFNKLEFYEIIDAPVFLSNKDNEINEAISNL